MDIIYFTTDFAQKIHDEIIDMSGGIHGLNNLGLLDSVLNFIQSDMYYPAFEDKLTHLVFSINKNHAFSDGNKRSSVALGAYFLEVNGYGYCIKKFIFEMENIAVSIADNKISKELLYKIVCSLIYEVDYSESLRLEIYEAIAEDWN